MNPLFMRAAVVNLLFTSAAVVNLLFTSAAGVPPLLLILLAVSMTARVTVGPIDVADRGC